MHLARCNLLQDKTRLALSVSGVALAVMLILVLNGLLAVMNHQITSYLDRSPGTLIVAQIGVSNLLGATSLLPPGAAGEVAAADGVDKVIPLLSQFVILDLHGTKQPAYLVGYEPEQGGGSWALSAGRQPSTNTELVMDRVLARRHDLQIGDGFEIMGQDFTIVGLSAGTASWMTSYFFIRISAAEKLLRAPGATSFLLVSPDAGVAPEDLRERLNDLSGVNALTKREMAANDLKLFTTVFSAPLRFDGRHRLSRGNDGGRDGDLHSHRGTPARVRRAQSYRRR